MAPSAYRRYKKFDSHLQRKVKEEAKKLSEDQKMRIENFSHYPEQFCKKKGIQ